MMLESDPKMIMCHEEAQKAAISDWSRAEDLQRFIQEEKLI